MSELQCGAEKNEISLYNALRDAGIDVFIDVFNDASDLNVFLTNEVIAILSKYPTHQKNSRTFTDQVTKRPMLEIPFAFDPFDHISRIEDLDCRLKKHLIDSDVTTLEEEEVRRSLEIYHPKDAFVGGVDFMYLKLYGLRDAKKAIKGGLTMMHIHAEAAEISRLNSFKP